jgi:hypothetical protein
MAQGKFKVDTTNSEFAYLSEDQTRTVISASGLEGGKENLPGIAYCHNVVPTKRGIQSVSYEPLAGAIPGLVGNVVDVRVIYSIQRKRTYVAFTDTGAIYSLEPVSIFYQWTLVTTAFLPVGPTYNKDLLSTGRANGVTYLYYPQAIPEPPSSNPVAMYYDSDLRTFVQVELLGLNWTATTGITATSGYLVAHTNLAMAWSSTISPLDFVPSAVTGAGGADVADLAGNILFAHPNSLGLIFYTDANAVAATYTGNASFPFKFREVAGSKGGINLDRIGYEANSDPQFVFTKGGIQAITSAKAEVILPDLTDFLTGRRIETLDTETWTYTRENLSPFVVLAKKVNYISSRYLIFSYGKENLNTPDVEALFTHAILYDTALDKTGKLLYDHADIFEFTDPGVEASKNTIALVQANGSVKLLNDSTDFRSVGSESKGVVVFGRIEASRTRMTTLLGVEIEAISQFDDSIDCVDLASLTGARDFEVIEGQQAPDSPQEVYRNYSFCNCARGHNVGIQGRFGIDTFIVTYTINGRR